MIPNELTAKDIFNAIKEDLIKLANAELKGYVSDLFNDTRSFIERILGDVKTWSKQLEQKQLTKEEFDFLIGGTKDRLMMSALTQSGLAIIKLQSLRDSIFQLILSSILKIVII